jgi:ADP-ribose pyrophosphatase
MLWETIKSKKKADFPLFKVFEDKVRLPNGHELAYYRVEKKPVVVILPVVSNKIVLVKQYRYPIKAISLELPAGHVKQNETPERCALRELKEETGFTADKIEKILDYNPSTEYSNQLYHIFIARDLVDGTPNREIYEIIDVELLDVESVIEKIMDGTITDGRTITSVFLAKFLNKL